MAKIAIFLLSYNSHPYTKKCIRSLRAYQDSKDVYDIVVFDNASEIPAEDSDFSECFIFRSEVNLGFAGGNNEAVRSYVRTGNKADFFLFLNNDTRVSKTMVRRLVEGYEQDPDAGFVLPLIYFERGHEYYDKSYAPHQRGRVIWYGGGSIDWANCIAIHRNIDEVDFGQCEKSFLDIQDFATGCCFLTTPLIWKKLRGFDERYFLYYEDVELSVRLKKEMHKKILIVPMAKLFHLNAGSSKGSGSSLHLYYQTRNRLRFGLHYCSFRTKLALLAEARRIFLQGDRVVRLAILHALGGKWGNQTHAIPAKRHLVS